MKVPAAIKNSIDDTAVNTDDLNFITLILTAYGNNSCMKVNCIFAWIISAW